MWRCRAFLLVAAVGCGGRFLPIEEEPRPDAGTPPSTEPGSPTPPTDDVSIPPPPPPIRDSGPPPADAAVDAPTQDVVVDAKNCDALATCGDASCIDLETDPSHCGACGRACAGTCGLGRCVVQLATGQDNPISMGLDDARVYWLNMGDAGDGRGAVVSVPKAGGVAPTTLVAGQTRPRRIAVEGSDVYWTAPPHVMSVPTAGGTSTIVATGIGPFPLTVDATHLYWVDTKNGLLGDLMKMPRAGGPAVVLSDTGSNVQRLTVSATAAFFFSGGDRLETTPLTGGARSYFHLFNNLGAALSGMAIDQTNVYVTFNNSGGPVVACPLGGEPCTILSNGNNGATAIASDGAHAYFLSPYGGAGAATGVIRKVSAVGGPTQVIVVSGHDLTDIAVDATSVYWINRTAGTISKVTPK